MIALTDHHCLPRDSAKFQKKLIHQIRIILLTKCQASELYFTHYNVQMINDEIDLTSIG